MARKPSIAQATAFCAVLVSWVLVLVAIIMPNWSVKSNAKAGLWSTCILSNTTNNWECTGQPYVWCFVPCGDLAYQLRVNTIAFALIACIQLTIVGCFTVCRLNSYAALVGCSACTCSVFLLIAWALYLGLFKDQYEPAGYSLGFCFAFVVAACGINLFLPCLLCQLEGKDKFVEDLASLKKPSALLRRKQDGEPPKSMEYPEYPEAPGMSDGEALDRC